MLKFVLHVRQRLCLMQSGARGVGQCFGDEIWEHANFETFTTRFLLAGSIAVKVGNSFLLDGPQPVLYTTKVANLNETKGSGNDDLDFSPLTFQPAASPLEM
jgi:hypothetical protein